MTDTERRQIEGHPLLLYDGVCALCNGLVRFLLKRDRQGSLRFTPLERPLGREVLERFPLHEFPDGVVLVTAALTSSERVYYRSEAVGAAMQLLGNPWKTAGGAMIVLPRWLREFGYGLIARLRYRAFGRYETCPLPTAEQRDRILGVYE
jgi:predicted DCC family thiol-disulfide oxidoreductase YuxK